MLDPPTIAATIASNATDAAALQRLFEKDEPMNTQPLLDEERLLEAVKKSIDAFGPRNLTEHKQLSMALLRAYFDILLAQAEASVSRIDPQEPR
jgi:hypothetical protein